MLKICFIGLGSIGCRHLRNLTELLNEKKTDYVIDALRSSKCELTSDINKKILNFYYNIEELPDNYDIIFITNPTSMHYNTLLNVRDKTKHVFLEKPVFETPEYDLMPFRNIKGVFYVACPLRYTLVMQTLKKIITSKDIFFTEVKCSSYLPDWRPQIDYRQTYSAQKELGGGVDIDLIHEWDYIIDLFGFPKVVKSIKGKYSNLEINSNDIALYIAEYEDMLIQVHLDYFGRVPQRIIQLYIKDDIIYADLIKGTISFLKSGKFFEIKDDRDGYQKRELLSFLDMIEGKKKNTNDISHAIETLKIAVSE